jgi:hypothetical protein
MKKQIFLLLTASLLLAACSRRSKTDNLHYFQDFEFIKGWFELASLNSGIKAHSGNYSIVVDETNEYSFGFSSKMGDISEKPLKKIKVCIWCYSPGKDCDGSLCVQIAGSGNVNKLWGGKLFSDIIKTENKWTRTVFEMDIPASANQKENLVRVFLWNKGTIPVYGDDVEITFTE